MKKIVAITDATGVSGASTVRVILKKSDGQYIEQAPGEKGVTRAYALALTREQLADVVSVEVRYDGRIASAASATVQFDLQLRATKRSDGTVVDRASSPVRNDAIGAVEDLGGVNDTHRVEAVSQAQMALEKLNIKVATDKKFAPAFEYATVLPNEAGYPNENWATTTMTLSARPTGTARPAKVVLTDDTETFWNAYKFVGFPSSFKFAPPIAQVKVDAFTGGAFVAGSDHSLSREGGDWVEGVFTTSATLQLPQGVTAEQVQGLRFTFMNANGTQWENTASPTQEVPVEVKRRAFLVSNPTVPVPFIGQMAAPGEPGGLLAKGGRTTNTVKSQVTSAVNDEQNSPLTADASKSTQIQYERGRTQVSLVKAPVGSQPAGQVIPFTLTVTNSAPKNSGDASKVLEPVITDAVELDSSGNPLLVFDPEFTGPKYSYAFKSGAATAAGTFAMPIDPAKVTVKETVNAKGEVTHIEFSFPDDTALMPGDEYIITINMMFRPGVTANQKVKNEFSIKGDQPFTHCNGVPADEAGVVEFESCADDTTVYPTANGAIRGYKSVKADDTSIGVTNVVKPAASAQCKPAVNDSLGAFYSGDCVPLTRALGTETWRQHVQNTGTLELPQVVTIERMPTPGDQGALAMLPRGSQWTPEWVGPIEQISQPGYRTPTAAPTYYYSNSQDPCIADLYPSEDTCAAGSWLPLTAGVDPASIKHIKTVYDFSDKPFKPGEVLGYTYKTRTPLMSSDTGSDTVAWHSVAIGAEAVDLGGKSLGALLPSEGRRVGVALATGPLKVKKLITGPGAEFAPDTFKLQVLCTLSVEGTDEVVELEPIVIAQAVTPGEAVLIAEELPLGTKCQVVDQQGVNGETSSTPQEPVTIVREVEGEDIALSTLSNEYAVGSFEVTKQVTGATNQNGTPISYGSFDVSVACTFLGQKIKLAESSATLVAGESWGLDGLPVGAECTLTENDAKGAAATLTADGKAVSAVDENMWEFTISENPTSAQLELTNAFALGAISLEKQVTGDGAAALSPDTVFTFEVLCTLETDDGTGSPTTQTVWQSTETLTKQQALDGQRVTIETLPQGATCTVTESGNAGATEATLAPDTSTVAHAIGTVDTPQLFTAVNRFDAGQVVVEKEIAGEGAEPWGTSPFEVTLACWTSDLDTEADEPNILIPGGATRTLQAPDALVATYDDLPLDAICAIEETKTGGATKSEFLDAVGEPIAMPFKFAVGAPTLLPLRNTFDVGAIDVTKTVTGTGAAEPPTRCSRSSCSAASAARAH